MSVIYGSNDYSDDAHNIIEQNYYDILDKLNIPLEEVNPKYEIKTKWFNPKNIVFKEDEVEIDYEIKEELIYVFRYPDVLFHIKKKRNTETISLMDIDRSENDKDKKVLLDSMLVSKLYLLRFGFLFYDDGSDERLLLSKTRDSLNINEILVFSWQKKSLSYLDLYSYGHAESNDGFISYERSIDRLNENKILLGPHVEWYGKTYIKEDPSLKIYSKDKEAITYGNYKKMFRVNFVPAAFGVGNHFVLTEKQKLFKSILHGEKITSKNMNILISQSMDVLDSEGRLRKSWYALDESRKNEENEWYKKRSFTTGKISVIFSLENIL